MVFRLQRRAAIVAEARAFRPRDLVYREAGVHIAKTRPIFRNVPLILEQRMLNASSIVRYSPLDAEYSSCRIINAIDDESLISHPVAVTR